MLNSLLVPIMKPLSYAWGDSNVTDEISCNGQGLCVMTNLRATLRRLRHPSRPRTLRVAAIYVKKISTNGVSKSE